MPGVVRGLRGIHRHAADRIGHCPGRGMAVVVVMVMRRRRGGVGMRVAHGVLSIVWPGTGGDVLDTYTPYGYLSSMNHSTKTSVQTRLKRIEGQVSGLHRMVEDDRYCIDILTQISAVRAALHKVEAEILRSHVAHCVSDAFATGDADGQKRKVEELVETIGRMTR